MNNRKTKFTRGPWRVCPDNSNQVEFNFKQTEDGYQADLLVDTTDSNAALIAAAPEMYSILERIGEDLNTIIDHVNTWTPEQIVNHCMDIQLNVVGSICAKARGES